MYFNEGEMEIKDLENGDKELTLTEQEHEILQRVLSYMDEHYDELEFSLRDFSKEDVKRVQGILAQNTVPLIKLNSEELKVIENVFAYASDLICDVTFEDEVFECVDDTFMTIRKHNKLENCNES